jgi:predicted transcriptional regulator
MKLFLTIVTFLFFTLSPNHAFDAGIGKSVSNVQLKNPDDKVMMLPFFGEKVLTVFYNDPDSKDVNDPLSDALKAHKFPKEKYSGIGIANCAETWLPNSVIRYAAKEKEKKYPGSVILIDEDKILSKAWELKDCNDRGYILVIGKDNKIKYVKSIKNQEESKAIIQDVIAIIEKEITNL